MNNGFGQEAPKEANPEEVPTSLMEMFGQSYDETEVPQFAQLPAGRYVFTVLSAGIEQKNTKNGEVLCVVFPTEVKEVRALAETTDDKGNPIDVEKLIGKQYDETFWKINEKPDAMGWVKKFMEAFGFQKPANANRWDEVLAAVKGANYQFEGTITTTVDKNDATRVYSNLDHKSIVAL